MTPRLPSMRRRRISRTALGIARCVTRAAADPVLAGLLPPGAAARTRLLLAAAAPGTAGTGPWQRRLVSIRERLWMPGATLHVALRKQWFDDRTRGFLATGGRQIVVLGAGLDTLAPRVAAERADVTVFELDHPATQEAKRRALGRDLPAHLHLLPSDLGAGDLERGLGGHAAFRRAAPTVVVAEGLFMYLDRSAVETVLAALRRLVPAGSRLLFSLVGVDLDGRPCAGPAGRSLRFALRLAGEPFRFGLAPDAAAGWLASHGFHLLDLVHDRELVRASSAAALLAGRPTLDWEYLAAAAIR